MITIGRTLALAIVAASACKSGPRLQPELAEDDGRPLGVSDLAKDAGGIQAPPGQPTQPPAAVPKLGTLDGQSGRHYIEEMTDRDVLLVGTPQKTSELVKRSDGLLQRKVWLEVSEVLVGNPAKPVIEVYEIVAYPSGPLMSTSRAEKQIVRLWPCVEEGGRERMIVISARIPTPRRLNNLEEDARKFAPKLKWLPIQCSKGTPAALEKLSNDIEADGA